MTSDLESFLASERTRIDGLLTRFLGARQEQVATIHDAVEYSLLGPGKRIRPILCLHVAELLGAEEALAAPTAVALEMIHCYSLVHDDLPAMDDDDLRRGRPTCHKAYNEAIAILAGDALLTLAFETIADTPEPDLVAPLVREIARAAGIRGMVGGQVADIEGEQRAPDAAALSFVHRHKTAALLRASVTSGGILARTPPETLQRLADYGEAIGLAFQVADDILDVVGERSAVGKAVGKDAAMGKLTYPGIHGLDRAREIAGELATRARTAIAPITGSDRLAELADYIVERAK